MGSGDEQLITVLVQNLYDIIMMARCS